MQSAQVRQVARSVVRHLNSYPDALGDNPVRGVRRAAMRAAELSVREHGGASYSDLVSYALDAFDRMHNAEMAS